jgi:hypothetical protein
VPGFLYLAPTERFISLRNDGREVREMWHFTNSLRGSNGNAVWELML